MLSRSVVSDSVQPHRQQPTRLLCPRDSPGKNTGVGCHFLLQGLPYDPAVSLLGLYLKESRNTNSKRYTQPNVHSSIIYNSQEDMEAAEVSINRCMDKEGVVYMYVCVHAYIHTCVHTHTLEY